ncbi:unnamed protein product [Coffea canephora]|uniref:Uncharacterized protein n=1 Tax=Coffea canephora TaxID=49390 RepID=A0A068U1T0_COFCA|nr:unnamed protein product [Coffea canephora]
MCLLQQPLQGQMYTSTTKQELLFSPRVHSQKTKLSLGADEGFWDGIVLGREYRELNLMPAVRFLGFLFVVGIPAHCTSSKLYVNSTRLASLDLYLPNHGFTYRKTSGSP